MGNVEKYSLGVRHAGPASGVLQVEGADEIGEALMQMDGALVDTRVGGARVDRAEQSARTGLDDLDGAAGANYAMVDVLTLRNVSATSMTSATAVATP